MPMKQVKVSEAFRRKCPEWIVFVVTHAPDGRLTPNRLKLENFAGTYAVARAQ